jgi:hypothetical protein
MRARDFLKEAKTLGGFAVKVVNAVNDAEVDEAIKLDAPSKKVDPEELKGFLGRTVAGTKTKQDRFKPYVHRSQIKITQSDDPNDLWDLDDLRQKITTRPKNLLGTNAKMQKSSDGDQILYDITLPALSGIVVDEETGEFVEITTCPNAGECKLFCYARQGGFVMYPHSAMSAARSLNFLVNDPEGWFDLVRAEIMLAKIQAKIHKGGSLLVRWHDAGDFFSKAYVDLAFDLARSMPDVEFSAYTKSADIALGDKPNNFVINFSTGAQPSQEKKVAAHMTAGNIVKQAVVVPRTLFYDTLLKDGNKVYKDEEGKSKFKDQASVNLLKQRLAKEYDVDQNTIITYDEMLKIPRSNEPKWSVIVPPGYGDLAAARRDVIYSFLLIHK